MNVTVRRTCDAWAECIRELVDEQYPEAEKIVLVLDNSNTHTPGSLFPRPPVERRMWMRWWNAPLRNWGSWTSW